MYPNTNLNCLVTVFSTLYKVIYERTLYVRPEVQNNPIEKAIVSNLSNTILKIKTHLNRSMLIDVQLLRLVNLHRCGASSLTAIARTGRWPGRSAASERRGIRRRTAAAPSRV